MNPQEKLGNRLHNIFCSEMRQSSKANKEKFDKVINDIIPPIQNIYGTNLITTSCDPAGTKKVLKAKFPSSISTFLLSIKVVHPGYMTSDEVKYASHIVFVFNLISVKLYDRISTLPIFPFKHLDS